MSILQPILLRGLPDLTNPTGKILIASPDNEIELISYLKNIGYASQQVNCLEAVYDHCQNRRIDAIVIHIELNGFEQMNPKILQKLLTIKPEKCPVLVVSNYGNAGEIHTAMTVGTDAYAIKPLALEQFGLKLAETIAKYNK